MGRNQIQIIDIKKQQHQTHFSWNHVKYHPVFSLNIKYISDSSGCIQGRIKCLLVSYEDFSGITFVKQPMCLFFILQMESMTFLLREQICFL